FSFLLPRPPPPTLFPYTTLFRSRFYICYAIAGWNGVLWGGCVCLLLTQQVTYLVNSATHILGFRDFETTDESRNNWLVAIFAMGDRKSTRLNSSHVAISYAVFCL